MKARTGKSSAFGEHYDLQKYYHRRILQSLDDEVRFSIIEQLQQQFLKRKEKLRI